MGVNDLVVLEDLGQHLGLLFDHFFQDEQPHPLARGVRAGLRGLVAGAAVPGGVGVHVGVEGDQAGPVIERLTH